jgi:hypothetical protein
MAQIKKGYIKVAVGDGIYRESNGRQLLSSQSKTMKQTSATKLHQVSFGKISVLTSRFRSSIAHPANGFEDGTMPNRLTQEFYQCIKTGFDMRTGDYAFEPDTFDGLSNFSFNASSTVRMSVNIKPSIIFENHKLKISMSEFEVLSSKIATKLTIPESQTGFTIFIFPTPAEGIATPIYRTDPGFVGFRRTLGVAREFTIPNQPIPASATKKVIP